MPPRPEDLSSRVDVRCAFAEKKRLTGQGCRGITLPWPTQSKKTPNTVPGRRYKYCCLYLTSPAALLAAPAARG